MEKEKELTLKLIRAVAKDDIHSAIVLSRIAAFSALVYIMYCYSIS
jgi:hypothetical protein